MAPRKQQPSGQFADLFKQCGVDAWPRGDFERCGDASVAVDRGIGRPVVHLVGAVPAANSLRLPRQRDGSGLAAPHRFLYIQLCLQPGQTYAVHADYNTADGMQHRLSVSNLFGGQEALRARRASGLQIFLPAAHDAWTLLAIDMHGVAAAVHGGGGPCGGGASRGGSRYSRLRSLHLCANMTVRGAFTSDVLFDWGSLPANLAFSAVFDTTQARVLWLPAAPEAGSAHSAAPRLQRPASPRPAVPQRQFRGPEQRQKQQRQQPAAADGSQELEVCMPPEPIAQLCRMGAYSGRFPSLLHWLPAGGSGGDGQEIVYTAGSAIIVMGLQCSGAGGGPGQAQQAQQAQQRHLSGHTRPVCAMAVSADGCWLASAEEGPGAHLRLWDLRQGLCVAAVPGHAGGTGSLDLSPDGCLLATAGVDAQGRQELVCWDVSACWTAAAANSGTATSGGESGRSGAGGDRSTRAVQRSSGLGRAKEVVRQGSEYNIQAVRFLPHDPSRLVTCGKNSIRVHRLKDGQLRSLSVPMDGVTSLRRPYSCGTLASATSATVGEVFTCLAVERPLRERPMGPRRLLAGTASGALYTVDLESRAVEGVTQAHSGALLAVAAHDGFCVTGSADRRLRLWGSDLREAYVEAGHEGAVTGIGLSPDGLWVAVGTDSGALSLLDVATSTYTALLRSHTAAVHAVALLGQQQRGGQQQRDEVQYCTAGEDGTVRVWSGADHHQLLELSAPGEAVLSIACHPGKPEVACGFRSGALRVFDAASAVMAAESRQHSGAVLQLAFTRQGRVLLSLGDDGCVCVYDAQRSYMPTTFLLAGFPLHATAMSASADGRLLATAALSLRPASAAGAAGPRPGSTASKGGKAAGTAGASLVLHDTLSMQPRLRVEVQGAKRISQVLLLPSGQVVLAITCEGRLLGYACNDGSLVLDVPRCLAGPCTAAVLDASGTFLVAGTAAGQLKVWGLHGLHHLVAQSQHPCRQLGGSGCDSKGAGTTPVAAAASDRTIRSLPCQDLGMPAGCAVLGAAFLDSRRLLTVGAAGEVCCWAFHGQPCNSCQASGEPVDTSSSGTLVVTAPPLSGRAPAAAAGGEGPHRLQRGAEAGQVPLRPVLNVAANCRARSQGAGSIAAGVHSCHAQEQQEPLLQGDSPGAGGSPTPRPLPPALQAQPSRRPPSAPPVLPRHQAPAGCSQPPAGQRQQSTSLPATPVRGRTGAKVPPIWERYNKAPEASLLVTSTPGERCTQVVRQQKQLRVSSPRKGGLGSDDEGCATGSGASGGGSAGRRRAQWVDGEVAQDRVPAYRPSQQLQLLPPGATVQRVTGFNAGAGFCWLPACGASTQELLYGAGNVLMAEDLASGQQRHLARLPRDVAAVAATADGRLAAVAVQPAAAGGSSAEIHLVALADRAAQGEAQPLVLCHHSFAVQALSFSPDGALLASLSPCPGSSATSLALWLVEDPAAAELVAGVELPGTVAGLAWEASRPGQPPTFYTAGSEGLVQWQLEPEALASAAVHMPPDLRGVALTAVAAAGALEHASEDAVPTAGAADGSPSSAGDGLTTVYVGDASGRVWQLAVDCGQDVRRSSVLAEVQGQAVSSLQAAGPHSLAVGTSAGAVLLLQEEAWSEKEAGWRLLAGEQLDGAVTRLHLLVGAAGGAEATATTASGTLWRVSQGVPALGSGGAAAQVLLCGPQRAVRSWQLAPGAAWKGAPPAAVVASGSSVAVWQMGVEPASAGRAPLVEFTLQVDATHAALADDASVCAAACADGSVCLYDVAEARLRWQAAGAAGVAGQGGVAALAVVQRLRGIKLVVVYRSGAVYVLDGASGQVAHRTLQFAVRQESGRQCPANFPLAGMAVHPGDTSTFALLGHQGLVVCKACWTKSASVDPLARLSFGPAGGSSLSIAPGDQLEAPHAAGAAPSVQAAFSRAHPGHLYCSNPAALGQLLLFDYTAQAVVKTLLAPVAGAASITALALHPTEAMLAAGTSAGSVLLLRLETESWAELAAHAEGSPVVGLAFSACGRRLFSAAAGAGATFCWELEK